MKQSQLFTKTKKDIGEDEKSLNASLLIRSGFIDKLAAGVYTYLPLGLKVLKNIENIIREEMNNVGGQEILMPALIPKEGWVKTDRWENFDALFKLEGHDKKEYALGATHEEVITPLLKKYIFSYKDLPKAVYQIQSKFRNEPRAKSGLLRGREFLMKDLYSFHVDQVDLDNYYEKVREAYFKIFCRLSLNDKTHYTFASGGAFSKYSHEFQTLSESGEDTIYICSKCDLAYNDEIINEIDKCQECGSLKSTFTKKSSIEIGNIFKLGGKFSNSFEFRYVDEQGQEKELVMGCYGIGLSRLMGTISEIYNDEKGLIWPLSVAPFQIHLVLLGQDKKLADQAERIYNDLINQGVEVLYDDRQESAGSKLNDSDLIGIPYRVVISEKTVKESSAEVKKRSEKDFNLVELNKLVKHLQGEIK